MGKIRCNARGCNHKLWIPRVGLEGDTSSSTCNQCKQVALCVEHFSILWKRGGHCPKCKSQQWTVHLFEGEPFSPMLQAELIAKGGTLDIIDDKPQPSHHKTNHQYLGSDLPSRDNHSSADDQYLKELSESSQDRSMVTLNVAAKSHQRLTKPILDPSPPNPHDLTGNDPFLQGGQPRSESELGFTDRLSGYRQESQPTHLTHVLPPPPRGWRLITQDDLSERARGLGDGIAIEREGPVLIRMMDDDRIIRQIELEGEVTHISQSPRKQRLIVERSRDGQRETVYFRGRELQGFITNPVLDDQDIFGAKFFSETGFVIFAIRPDQRLDLREGRFKKSRQVQTRVVGTSIKDVPLPPSVCNKGHLAFFFKGVSENRYLPVCRRISNGEDIVIGGELTERPIMQAASSGSTTLSWMTHTGDVWVSSGAQHPTHCVSSLGTTLLAVSSDGRHIAWVGEESFYTYNVEARKVDQWGLPQGLLAIGWRGAV
jgi:hypothetical protein